MASLGLLGVGAHLGKDLNDGEMVVENLGACSKTVGMSADLRNVLQEQKPGGGLGFHRWRRSGGH